MSEGQLNEAAAPAAPAKTPNWVWIVGIAAVCVAWAIVKAATHQMTPDEAMQDSEKRAIAMCWSSTENKAIDDSAKRFAAGVCYDMERTYERKWGRKP